jgi:ferrochelatase
MQAADAVGNGPVGVVLANLGGPSTLADVEPFLFNLFSDRDIIQLPLGAVSQPVFARLISKLRSPTVRRRYAGIGGGSPQLAITRAQAAQLEATLNRNGHQRFRTFVAMRYWHPTPEETLEAMDNAGIRRVIVTTLYPQYSSATTGSMDRELARVLSAPRWRDRFEVTSIRSYAVEPRYLDALADLIRRGLDGFPAARRDHVVLLFSAHSLPVKVLKTGDPYVQEIEATRHGVMQKLGVSNRHLLSYQSRIKPVRWIGPGTDEVLRQLSREGVKEVLAVPISFVSDHIETLYDLDQLYTHMAREIGIGDFRRTESLNVHPMFIEALAAVVERELERHQ